MTQLTRKFDKWFALLRSAKLTVRGRIKRGENGACFTKIRAMSGDTLARAPVSHFAAESRSLGAMQKEIAATLLTG